MIAWIPMFLPDFSYSYLISASNGNKKDRVLPVPVLDLKVKQLLKWRKVLT
jgi:hypothetical protein